MSHTVIDSKTQKESLGFWPVTEDVSTTITLLNLGDGNFGIDYYSKFSGVKDGKVKGGPIKISSDLNKTINKSPEVKVIISNYHKTSNHITMRIKIIVDIPVLGTETIYDKTLGGAYTQSTGWDASLVNLGQTLKKHKKIVQ